MTMSEWAAREIEIACKKERGGALDDEWDYGVACYKRAHKAYKSLMEDGHSGMSIGITKAILNRLIDGKPLTPIEDTDDIWGEGRDYNPGYITHQCMRMFSLFKDVYPDGTVKYHDNDRVVSYDVDNPEVPWSNGFITNIINEMFPITMPYIPEDKPFKVYRQDFLYDEKNGDYDTMAILYVIKPDGERIDINRYFKDGEDSFEEIHEIEYWDRYNSRVIKK